MGTCISKCKPKKTPHKQKQQQKQQEEKQSKCLDKVHTTSVLIQDKLVISQPPISCPPPPTLISPRSPSKSSSSSKYPTTSTSSSSCSCSSLSSASSFASSTSSSTLTSSLDRSFSNDFLWSCVKENPHLIQPDFPNKNVKIKSSPSTRSRPNSGTKPIGPKQHPPSPHRVVGPVAQKRPRCGSPSNLTRQKSFRREPDRPLMSNSRELRPISPSPSRRFKGEVMTTSMGRENYYVRPPSPNSLGSRRYNRPNNSLGKKENISLKRAGPKIEDLAIEDLVSGPYMDWAPVEDANNPHISLDCFIFL